MLFRCLSVLLLSISGVFSAEAAECLDIFPTLSQNYGPKLNLPDFKYSSEDDGSQTGNNLALPSGQYKDVKVSEGGSVFFTELNAEYRFKKIELKDRATAQFVPGDYWVKKFEFKDDSTLAVIGSGTVRIYVEKLKIEKNVNINDANGHLIFISYDDIDDVDDELSFTGVMYADEEIKLDKDAIIRGSITAENVNLGDTLSETYQESSITDADFNGMCGPAVIIVDYRFDECSYTGAEFEVVDQTGNYSAQSFSNLDTSDDAQIERAANLSDASHHIETSIPIDNEFSVSTWFKKPTADSGNIYLVLGAMDNDGGDLLYLDRDTNYRWGVYNGTNSSDGTFEFGDLAIGWHHMVLAYGTTSTTLYIDGDNKGSVAVRPSGTIKYIGTSYDDIDTSSPQGFRSALDEFKIYDQELSSTDITEIYTNELAKNNYDGTSRGAVICDVEPIVEFRFEETGYSGVANEVIDETGNFNAIAVNGATTDGASPALSTNPGTCRYGSFNDNYVALPDSFENLQGSFTITAWVNPSNLDAGSRIFADDEFNQTGYALSLGDPGNGKLRFYSRGVNPISVDTTTSIPINTWSFVTAVHDSDNKTRQIYVNGVPQVVTGGGTSNTYSGNWGTDTGVATIGGETDAGESNNRFTGSIDEVRVYESALSESDIIAIFAETHPCEVIHHFEINHDAQGLTCVAEPLTIKACSDAACSNTIATPTDVQIFANGVLKTTVTVAGETATDFNHLVEETITLSSDQTYTCNNGGDTSCDIIFLNAGFLLDVNSSSDVSSCESVNFEIKAVKLSDSGVSCAPAFTGSQALDFSFSYSNPSAGTILPVLNGTNMAASGASETRSVVFDANGEATLPIEYHDAGALSFTISENVSSGVSSSTINKDFYPSKIVVTAQKNDATLLNNATSEGTPKQVAADSFALKYSGQCNDNTETPNYQPQSSSAVELAVRHVLPSSLTSVLGDLTVEGTIINSTGSANTVWQSINTTEKELVASYDEVGVINISVKDTDYLGNNINSSGFIDVGRFYPSYFDVSITHNTFQNTGITGATDFTYIGQPFGYSDAPILTITAQNSSGFTTENYTETSFQKLTEANVIRSFSSADTAKDGVDTITKMVVESTPVDGVISKLSNGVMDYTFSDTDTFTYSKDANSEVSEFTVSYDILISSITDSDGVAINVDTTLPLTVQPAEGVQRFGRLVLENSFGSENSSLAQSFEVEFLNTSGVYQRNADDDFSVISNIATNWSYSNATDNIVISDLVLSGNDGSFSSGQIKNIELSSGGNQGTIDVEYTTPDWLKYNWSGKVSNLHNEDANATATFGVYRGNDRIISWREVGN